MKSLSNLILIGMPGVGKSTVGVLLAKATRRDFVDTDVRIQSAEGRRLQEILDAEGLEAFCRIEERRVLALRGGGKVIATGGSVVYSRRAMEHLRRTGRIVWLDLDLGRLRRRLADLATRGVVREPGQSLAGLYRQRRPLYRRWADLKIRCGDRNQDQVVSAILRRL